MALLLDPHPWQIGVRVCVSPTPARQSSNAHGVTYSEILRPAVDHRHPTPILRHARRMLCPTTWIFHRHRCHPFRTVLIL